MSVVNTAGWVIAVCRRSSSAFAIASLSPRSTKINSLRGLPSSDFRAWSASANVLATTGSDSRNDFNMLKSFRESEPVVAKTFAEADQALKSLLGKPLSEFIFVDRGDKDAIA